MIATIVLDSGPLGLLAQRPGLAIADACRAWLERHVQAGVRALVPEIADYEVRVLPRPRTFLEQMTEQLNGNKDDSGHVRMAGGEDALLTLVAPYLLGLDARRAAAVVSVLRRLEILQKEGVVLTMPEILPQD